MTRSGIDQLLYLMDRAFEGDPSSATTPREHALLDNLSSVDRADWVWLPPGGRRSILTLVREIGDCKYVYDSHAFGDGSLHWNRSGSIPSIEADAPAERYVDWIRIGHVRFREHVAGLTDDAELLRLRRNPHGQIRETRSIIANLIEHDIYHAGEINHLRALRQGND